MREQSYFSFFKLGTAEEVIDEFYRTLLYTNRDLNSLLIGKKLNKMFENIKIA